MDVGNGASLLYWPNLLASEVLCTSFFITNNILVSQVEKQPRLKKIKDLISVGTTFWEEYKHYKGKSKYFKGKTTKRLRQAGTELGQAQLQLELGFKDLPTNYHYISWAQ